MMGWLKFGHHHAGHGHHDHDACGEVHAGGEGPVGRLRDWHERHAHRGHHAHHDGPDAFAGPEHDGDVGAFGVRRPLRFLSHKLELEEGQVAELAAVLNDLKTERAQAAVDHRRSTSAIADAIAGEALDAAKLTAATSERVKSAERLRDAVEAAIKKIHTLLTPEQRGRFAYLIRTGVLSV
jgi:Spy/CpxP family protein refolding chaperone